MEKWQGKLIIKDITLQNFRQFEHLSVQFDPELTVLIGVNGSGKTTVLEALAKAIRIFPERIQRPDSALDDIRKFFISTDIKHQALTSEVDINVRLIENEEEKKRGNEDETRDNILKFREEESRYRQFAENEIQQASIGYANDPLERRKVEEAIWNDFKIQIKKGCCFNSSLFLCLISLGAYEQQIFQTDRTHEACYTKS
jgi:predicted ATP-dependent endonuclease of OLD family